MLLAMTFEYVDVETAKSASGTRLVINALVPSPWSEAMKGLFVVAQLPALAVRRALDTKAIDAWTGTDNAPALFHGREPIRTNWAAIVAFVDRHAPDRGILPTSLAGRVDAMGTLEMIAGEGGLGWNARIAMIDASFASGGTAGFPEMTAKFLAKRYGYVRGVIDATRERIKAQLDYLAAKLTGEYFGGKAPNAVDIYTATFLTPVAAPVTEAECPAMIAPLRKAFDSAHAAFGPLVSPALLAHRERMFERHLPRPIVL